MIVYRISDCRYVRDLSGRGAALYGGRWNSKDTHMVYTAQSRALALLESVAHIGRIPAQGYCMATIEIPDNSIVRYPLERLPQGWQNNPPPDHLARIGDLFTQANKYLALEIPSVLMMEEHNYLLNPTHPLFHKVKIIADRQMQIDERLYQA